VQAPNRQPRRSGRPAATLVAVNGLGGLDHLWDGFRAALPASVELRVLDLLGHGVRPPAADYRYSALVDDVVARTADLAPFPLIGWSVGGAVAWLVAARHPARVTGLVLLDPAAPHQSPFKDGPTPEPAHPYTYASAGNAARALAAIDPTVTEDDVRRTHRENALGRWEPRFDPAIFPALVEDAREHGEAFRRELGAIAAPTLVVTGERSFVRPEQVAEIVAGIPGAREATARGAGHFMVRERPEQLVRLVLDFLAPGGRWTTTP
jgi:pimeloyl-ACP methyl ester carboxylesterase